MRKGEIRRTKCLDANNAFGSENNKPVKCLPVTGTGSPAVEGFRKKHKMAKDYRCVKS